jgi:signal transduction histidine kinase
VAFRAADCVVNVDPVWFRQAVDNLVDNALRHTPPGGRVEVRATRRDDSLTVTVEDTGPGFGEAFLGAAFEPFTRASRSPGVRHGSAGLGLAVVSTIARAHGGRAWAQNRAEGGARVTMVLNAAAPPHQRPDS